MKKKKEQARPQTRTNSHFKTENESTSSFHRNPAPPSLLLSLGATPSSLAPPPPAGAACLPDRGGALGPCATRRGAGGATGPPKRDPQSRDDRKHQGPREDWTTTEETRRSRPRWDEKLAPTRPPMPANEPHSAPSADPLRFFFQTRLTVPHTASMLTAFQKSKHCAWTCVGFMWGSADAERAPSLPSTILPRRVRRRDERPCFP